MRFDDSQPTLAFRDLHASSQTLDVLRAVYLPLYGLTDADFSRMFARLAFVAGLVRRADAEVRAWQGEDARTLPPPWAAFESTVREFLAAQGLDSERARESVRARATYYEAETALLDHPQPTRQLLLKTLAERPTDRRLLHVLVLEITGRGFDPRFFDALAPLELWGCFNADLASYVSDVQAGRFNALRVLARLHGEIASEIVGVEMDRCRDAFTERLARLPASIQVMLASARTALQEITPPAIPPRPILEA